MIVNIILKKNRLHFDDLKGMIEILFSAVGFMFLRFYNLNYLSHIGGHIKPSLYH